MPVRLAAATLFMLAMASWAGADDAFPYRAVVTADEVNVRSGPGDNYYSVQKLARGETVEVYRHDPGGWFAIRPPEGSFSWVAAEFVKPIEGGLGVVVGDRVVARVGSVYSDIRDCIQVRLDNGEEVEILDVQRTGNVEGPKTWYKIAPPAGEFRWVQGRLVERETRANRAAADKVAPKDRVADVPAEPTKEPTLYEPDEKKTLAAVAPATGAPTGADQVIALERRLQELANQVQQLTGKRPATGWTSKDSPATARKPLPPSQATTVAESLDEIDLQLSEIVTDDTLVWDFRQITSRAEEALARAESASDRSRARALLVKIEKFEDIRQRYMAVVAHRNAAERDARGSTTGSRLARRPELEDESAASRYDGIGRLTQVVAQKAGAPRYALLDDQGKVLYYVSPAPGVNLRPYLDREVGVSGILGYLPDQDVRHVTAKRVEPLEANRLR